MMISKLLKPRSIVVALVMLVLAAAVYGFAAANTVDATGAGAGSGTISGYEITNVEYTLNSTDPQVLDGVNFDVASLGTLGQPTTVKVQLNSTGGAWYACSAGTAPAWTCDTTGTSINVEDMDTLNVVAAQ
jgi:hypothetical protein